MNQPPEAVTTYNLFRCALKLLEAAREHDCSDRCVREAHELFLAADLLDDRARWWNHELEESPWHEFAQEITDAARV